MLCLQVLDTQGDTDSDCLRQFIELVRRIGRCNILKVTGIFPLNLLLLQICSERKHAMHFFPEPIIGPMLIKRICFQKCIGSFQFQ